MGLCSYVTFALSCSGQDEGGGLDGVELNLQHQKLDRVAKRQFLPLVADIRGTSVHLVDESCAQLPDRRNSSIMLWLARYEVNLPHNDTFLRRTTFEHMLRRSVYQGPAETRFAAPQHCVPSAHYRAI